MFLVESAYGVVQENVKLVDIYCGSFSRQFLSLNEFEKNQHSFHIKKNLH